LFSAACPLRWLGCLFATTNGVSDIYVTPVQCHAQRV
jgi:hypothetical protein